MDLNSNPPLEFRTKDIESLVYLMKKAHADGQPKPIVFLGAGASVSAGIPSAHTIMQKALELYCDKPEIKRLSKHQQTYANVLKCLNAKDRNTLLRTYIKEAKVNVAHIYLAQLLKHKYVDYVLTVNFDDLLLRASALYNFIPPTYDIAILNDITTGSLPTGSVTYLHGQQHGLWLLNTDDEMNRVVKSASNILSKISVDRPWIILGYSGDDPILNVIGDLGRFDNELFWVSYLNNDPSERVHQTLFENNNKGAFNIKGYDADSFFLKLHSELELETPKIFHKPFSFLMDLTENIKDIDVPKKESTLNNTKINTELYKYTKDRFENSRKLINDAVHRYEQESRTGHVQTSLSQQEIAEKSYNQEVIDLITRQHYEEAHAILEDFPDKTSETYKNLKKTLHSEWAYKKYEIWLQQDANPALLEESLKHFEIASQYHPEEDLFFNSWGVALYQKGFLEKNTAIYERSIEKYERAQQINPQNNLVYANWGLSLYGIYILERDTYHLQQAHEKVTQALQINQDDAVSYVILGNILFEQNKPFETFESFDDPLAMYQQALALDPKYVSAHNGVGNILFERGKAFGTLADFDAAKESFEKALTLENNSVYAINGLGYVLTEHSQQIKEEAMLDQGITHFERAKQLDPDNDNILENLGVAYLYKSGYLDSDSEKAVFIQKGKASLEAANAMGGPSYNLACLYAQTDDREKAFEMLEKSLERKEETVAFVEKDSDWDAYRNDPKFQEVLAKYQ
ncbi:TPR end-of-group domain-containing protein [Altibacter sp. HG106]|uniref:TPR end-of-group domain-containing protein n=1 Tax=Altibacter sp. HG106 TaxID=3023937 RepID=UPI00235005A0|nr:tetratricopeptide repeat protein [Altibacter sp. HG106]MDC7995905.1 tetratricopeptide repeat protein [Altibacter sp. HG106]